MRPTALTYSLASTPDEFEQVFRLNHTTFTSEIPQHAPHADGLLIDRFHAENEYVLCKCEGAVVGMLALRGSRPFSLDQKLSDLDAYLPAARRTCEIRLLSIKPAWRHSHAFTGLIRASAHRCAERGFDFAVISATTRQLKLYRHLGFTPFGPLVGTAGAQFQPMLIAVEQFNLLQRPLAAAAPNGRASAATAPSGRPLLLTPGPVEMHASVRAALARSPQPHRSDEVMSALVHCSAMLCRMTQADRVQILLGGGTLANDAVAQQLRARGPGLVLSNGEFGERLIDHAARAGLPFEIHRAPWGATLNFAAIEASLQSRPAWVWMVHCETSTGMHNDLAACRALAARLGAEIALDCVSAFGNLPLNLAGIRFATGVSSKGAGAVPGLSFVLHRRDALAAVELVPRYLDLHFASTKEGMPFTQSSPLIAALEAALPLLTAGHFASRAAITAAVHRRLTAAGIAVVTVAANAAPGVVTIALPSHIRSAEAGAALLQEGVRIAFDSNYLITRNWVQIAWMGAVDAAPVMRALRVLSQVVRHGAPREVGTPRETPAKIHHQENTLNKLL